MRSVEFFSLRRQHAECQDALEAAAARVLESGQFILGSELERFERQFAVYSGAKYAVGVGNGLDALTLSLRAHAIGPGDEVIVPAHTFIATWLAVEQTGASVVPVDIDPHTYNIDASKVIEAITPRTRAVIAVHLYGQPADMTSLIQIGDEHQLAIIEDAAQAHGATYRGRRVGSLGAASAFSFYPTKNLGALGDGGVITTNDESIAAFARKFRNYGSSEKYRHDELGYNSRLDEIQAAYLNVKLGFIEDKNMRRRAIAARYTEGLRDLPGLTLPTVAPDSQSVWHLYVVRLSKRDEVQKELAANGIRTMVHYPTPPHRQPAYEGTPLWRLSLPHAERAADQVLSLPMWPEMTDDEVDHVIHSLRRVLKAASHTLSGAGISHEHL
jgi:dTDP-3-amino-3,4,6-trideoxy-alpha-D-glucose transaminase